MKKRNYDSLFTVKKNKLFSILLLLPFFGLAQNAEKLSGHDLENQKLRVKQLVQFFEYALNIVGNDTTPAADKESIQNTAFLKIFKDNKVQIEDDLDERSTVTNKNIKAYLQDVDYFFTNVSFKFTIQDISYNTAEKGRSYFKVTLSRHLEGKTLAGEVINNTKKRFIEINYEPRKKDLKIVSVYSSQISESDELKNWWSQTPNDWKKFFLNSTEISDSVSVEQLKSFVQLTSIDISNNKTLNVLTPITELENLTEIKLSGSNIKDLTPLLDLNKLEVLDISSTGVKSLDPLKYSVKLKELNISNTQIRSLEVLKKLKAIEKFSMAGDITADSLWAISELNNLTSFNGSNANLQNVDFLKNLLFLQIIDISQNSISNISFCKNLKQLSELDISNTAVGDLSPLQSCMALKILKCNYTNVGSLEPLSKLPALQKIYCDKTRLDRKQIASFAQTKPGILLVFQSESQQKWWEQLSAEWKQFFKTKQHLSQDPTMEQVSELSKITEVDISGSNIDDLSPLKELLNLKTLKANKTKIGNLSPLENIVSLETLEFSNTQVSSLEPLKKLSLLKLIKCDGTQVKEPDAQNFRNTHPKCVLIYKTDNLTGWWNNLPEDWKNALKEQKGMAALPATESIHKLILSDTLIIRNKNITTLEPVRAFSNLKYLSFSNTYLESLSGIDCASGLQYLQCSLCPLKSLGDVANLHDLRVLDCSNTALEKPKQLLDCGKIEILKINGTKISSLKWLEKMQTLKQLDISNTRVSNLNPIKKLPLLERLACYNTKIRKGRLNRYLKTHDHCVVRYY